MTSKDVSLIGLRTGSDEGTASVIFRASDI